MDETYVRVNGRWCYLYRAIDSAGATIDSLLSAFRDADADKRLFCKALSGPAHPPPRVINTDLAPIYGSAIPDMKKEGIGLFNNVHQMERSGSRDGILLPDFGHERDCYTLRLGRLLYTFDAGGQKWKSQMNAQLRRYSVPGIGPSRIWP